MQSTEYTLGLCWRKWLHRRFRKQPLVGSLNNGMKVMLQGATKQIFLSVMKSLKYTHTGFGSVQLLHFLLLQMLSF